MRSVPPTLVVYFGAQSAAAMVVNDQGGLLIRDPSGGEARWPCDAHWDIEQIADLFTAMRAQAERHAGPVNRALVTIPTSVPPGDPRRARMIAAGEAAGFGAVELLIEAAGALWAPGSPVQVGEVVLIYDLGATFEAAVVRAGDDLPDVIGHASIVDWPAETEAAQMLELTIACCLDLLTRLNLDRQAVHWVPPVGGGALTAGLDAALERGLGIAVARMDEPELALVRGTAHWLPRSGPRTVMARPAVDRMTPLVYTIPGGSARLLRWLVRLEETYEAGTPLARVRLAGGAIWDLTARTRGTLDQVLVEGGSPVTSGEWLALARHG